MPRPSTPLVRAHRKGDKYKVRELVAEGDWILAVDPGADGIALLFEPFCRWKVMEPPEPFAVFPFNRFGGMDFEPVDEVLRGESIGTKLLVVLEESFGGGRLNIASDLALARYSGAVIGALAAVVRPHAFNVAMVNATTWLSAATSRAMTAKAARAQRKAISEAHTLKSLGGVGSVHDRFGWPGLTLAAHREAFCDAYTMATWWGRFHWTTQQRVSRGTGSRGG